MNLKWVGPAILVLAAIGAVSLFAERELIWDFFGNNSALPGNLSGNNSPGNQTAGNISGNQTSNGAYGLDSEHRGRSERLISLFENGVTEMQYGYAQNLDDGRGITCGRAGFCTGCADAYEVVEKYTERKPGNNLAKYLPELKRLLTAENSDDISGLDGFIEDWKSAANDRVFRDVQDEVSDESYYTPAMDHAKTLGIKTNLGKAILYDSILQHGDGNDLDGLPYLIKRTKDKSGGTPLTGVDESKWLTSFLSVRRADLTNPSDPATRDEWAQSVSRVDVFSEILQAGNLNLDGPIEIRNPDYEGEIIS